MSRTNHTPCSPGREYWSRRADGGKVGRDPCSGTKRRTARYERRKIRQSGFLRGWWTGIAVALGVAAGTWVAG
jgi:hypothetical protein